MAKNKKHIDLIVRRKRLKKRCIERFIFFSIFAIVICMMIGAQQYKHFFIGQMFTPLPDNTYPIPLAVRDVFINLELYGVTLRTFYPFSMQPMIFAAMAITIYGAYQLTLYTRNENTMNGEEEGSAAFNEDYDDFKRNYTYPPKAFSASPLHRIIYFPKRLIGKTLKIILHIFYHPAKGNTEENIEALLDEDIYEDIEKAKIDINEFL